MEPASGSKDLQHVYELRLYQVNEGKMDALIARFGDHTDVSCFAQPALRSNKSRKHLQAKVAD